MVDEREFIEREHEFAQRSVDLVSLGSLRKVKDFLLHGYQQRGLRVIARSGQD